MLKEETILDKQRQLVERVVDRYTNSKKTQG
jgi:hypothetical protein